MFSVSRIFLPFTENPSSQYCSAHKTADVLTKDSRESIESLENQISLFSLLWQLLDLESAAVDPILLSNPLYELLEKRISFKTSHQKRENVPLHFCSRMDPVYP
jgi:hypothetical protein